MTNRPHKELSDRVLNLIADVKSRVSHGRIDLQKNIAVHTELLKKRCDPELHGEINEIERLYNALYGEFIKIVNEEQAIKRIETSAHRRALLYRTLTTILLGLCIIGIYALGQYFDVQMPFRFYF